MLVGRLNLSQGMLHREQLHFWRYYRWQRIDQPTGNSKMPVLSIGILNSL